MLWIYADPHYYHGNIIAYENRPFNTLEEMHKTMINNHNHMIKKEDKVFILGDFSFGNKEQTTEIVSKLNGHKILILGNHDKARSRKWWLDTGFNEVSKYPIIIKDFFILSHEPVYISKSMPYINIHGHLHSNTLNNQQYINVGLDCTNFYPKNLDFIIYSYKD